MDDQRCQHDLAEKGPRKNGEDQRAAAESQSLLHGLGCSVFEDAGADLDADHYSLFGGDADIDSLFGGLDGDDAPDETPARPLSCPLTLPLSPRLPHLPQADSSESFCDVSTLFLGRLDQQQQQTLDDGLDDLDGLDVLGLHFDFDMDFGLAVELEMARDAQQQQPTLSTPSSVAPAAAALTHDELLSFQAPAPGIDTLFRAAGLDTPDDQAGHGRAADDHGNDDNDGGDDDVVILSSRQIQPVNPGLNKGFVSAAAPQTAAPHTLPPVLPVMPHYLELRPRCPQGPPPARIDLSQNVEELLPHVQLQPKLSIRGIHDLLGLDADAGRYLVTACQRHLADPAHTVATSGSSDPAALRVLKVTLILSSLALLVEGGVGARWFGPDASLEPRSMHVWPDDSTTLTLLFIQLLYRLTRNNNSRARQRKRSAGNDKADAEACPPSPKKAKSPTPPTPTPPPSPPKSPTQPQEPRPPKRKRKPKAAAPSAATPQPPFPALLPPRPNFAYSSPRVVRDSLLNAIANTSKEAAPVNPLPARRPPADAVLRYRVNIVDRSSQDRMIPQIVLAHDGEIRRAGYSYLVRCCAQRGRAVDSISIMTLLGLERVSSDVGWDRVVGRVHDELLMDGEVRVLVCL